MTHRIFMIIQFMAVMICSIVIGTGIGFLQGLVAFAGSTLEGQIKLSSIAAFYGAVCGVMVGVTIYTINYFWKIEFIQFVIVISVALLAGCLSGWMMNMIFGKGAGWFSMYITLLVAAFGISIMSKIRIDPNDEAKYYFFKKDDF